MFERHANDLPSGPDLPYHAALWPTHAIFRYVCGPSPANKPSILTNITMRPAMLRLTLFVPLIMSFDGNPGLHATSLVVPALATSRRWRATVAWCAPPDPQHRRIFTEAEVAATSNKVDREFSRLSDRNQRGFARPRTRSLSPTIGYLRLPEILGIKNGKKRHRGGPATGVDPITYGTPTRRDPSSDRCMGPLSRYAEPVRSYPTLLKSARCLGYAAWPKSLPRSLLNPIAWGK